MSIEEVDGSNELINLLERKLNVQSPFSRADVLNAYDRLHALATRRVGSEDESLILEKLKEMITRWHVSRIVFTCEGFRGDYARTILRIAKQKTDKKLEDGEIDYLTAEHVRNLLDGALDQLDE